MIVSLAPQFRRKFKKLDPNLKEEVREKMQQFANNPEDPILRAHLLKGNLKGVYSFSINYKIRVLYQYLTDEEVVLLNIGSHNIYK